MPNQHFSSEKLERNAIHKPVSILQDKSIGALKITYGHHPWSQGCSLCIRNAFSGTFIIFPVYTVISKLNKGINPNLFLIKGIVRDIIMEALVILDLHPRSQECPPRVPDGC